jgi:quinolinate synthase
MQNNPSSTIGKIKQSLGARLAILAHHYQQDEVVRHADIVGDSLELARRIRGLDAEYIVFCGVFFMAETAAVLAAPGQKVILPASEAGCPMSEMAQASLFEETLAELDRLDAPAVPLAYVNTQAAVKAVCGRRGGAVCTSANAPKMLNWALERGERVLFAPDMNLALNTADRLNMPESDRLLLGLAVEAGQKSLHEAGSMGLSAAADRKLLVWPGYCSVHQCMTPEDVLMARLDDPETKVVVHPECSPEVVALADAVGSTSFIIDYCDKAPTGSRIAVGTEIHLVRRLEKTHRETKMVFPLKESGCMDMAATDEELLASVLSRIEEAPVVRVSDETTEPAAEAVDRMLEAGAK